MNINIDYSFWSNDKESFLHLELTETYDTGWRGYLTNVDIPISELVDEIFKEIKRRSENGKEENPL